MGFQCKRCIERVEYVNKKFTEDQPKHMTIKEAILKGCEIRPEQDNTQEIEPNSRACCVLAAAALGAGLATEPTDDIRAISIPYTPLQKLFPILKEMRELPYVDGYYDYHDDVLSICWTLNGPRYKWTREQIADWLEGLEK